MYTLKEVTDNSLTRYYQERINNLEAEKTKLYNEARSDFRITLDFWIYSQRMIQNYVQMHKTSNHNIYLDLIINTMEALKFHNQTAEDTSTNRLRLEVITLCEESILKCEQFNTTK